jgi:peptidyl-prolyl cis-trans isomerase SurA
MINRPYILIAAVTALLTLPTGISAQNNVIDEVVWVVGDEAIYKSEVEEARQEGALRGIRWEGDPYCIIPEQIAVNKLFMNQAELDSITVSPEDVNFQVDMYYNEMVNQAGSAEKLEEYYGMGSDQIKIRLYETREADLIIGQVREKLMERVRVTPADVRRFLKDVPPDDIPYIPTQVEVQIITIDPVIPQEEIRLVRIKFISEMGN